jgi:SRSO17 transposase
MEVFVLMGSDYEGDMLLGVYASEQEAHDAYGVYTRDRDRPERYDSYYVARQVVGAYADVYI